MTDFIWFIHVCCGSVTGTSIAVILCATGALDIFIDRIEDFFEYRRLKKRYGNTLRTDPSLPSKSSDERFQQDADCIDNPCLSGAWNYVSIEALSAKMAECERKYVEEKLRKEEQRKAKVRQFFRRIFTFLEFIV